MSNKPVSIWYFLLCMSFLLALLGAAKVAFWLALGAAVLGFFGMFFKAR